MKDGKFESQQERLEFLEKAGETRNTMLCHTPRALPQSRNGSTGLVQSDLWMDDAISDVSRVCNGHV